MNLQAETPFVFRTSVSVPEITGLAAYTAQQLLEQLLTVPGACVFYHTHNFLHQHLYLNPEPCNDFAAWAEESLGDRTLAEALASIDTVRFDSIRGIREELVSTLSRHLAENPDACRRFAPDSGAFHFIKAVSFVCPTGHTAADLREFAAALRVVSVSSLYFHMFTARLRLERGGNDFSRWLADSLRDEEAARRIAALDPYTCTAEVLRGNIAAIIERRLAA